MSSFHPLRALVRDQGHPPGTVRLVLRGVTILSIVWQGAWMLPDSTLWPWKQEGLAPRPFIWLALACWVGLILATWGPLRLRRSYIVFGRLDIAFLLLAAAAAFLTDGRFEHEAWRPAASLVNLAVAMAGLLLTTSVAIEVLAVAVGLEFLVLLLDSSASGGPDSQDIVLIPVYALCAGVAAIVARRGLVLAAERVDLVQRETVAAESRLLGLRRIQQRIDRQEQRLHETVLNTLNAIARGGMRLDDALRNRCRDSIAVLRRMRTIESTVPAMDAQDWQLDLEDSVRELCELGITVEQAIAVDGTLPPDVYAASITAIREACTNIRRHASATAVMVEVSASGAGTRHDAASVRIRVSDDGRGFDPESVTARFGLPHAMKGPMAELGGAARITSSPGGGTRIDIDWQQEPGQRDDRILRDLGTSARVFAAPVLTAFAVFGLISLVMTLPELSAPALGWCALMLYVLVSAVLIWSTRTSGVPGWLVIVVALLAPVIFRLQEASVGVPAVGPWVDWGSECLAAMFLVIAAAGRPWWAWLAGMLSWLLIQGGFPLELIAPGSALIYAGALYARSVRHNSRRYDGINAQRLEELATAQVAERDMALLGRRYSLLDESDATTLLDGIAEGRLDPADAGVRELADREEQYIRAVMRIGAAEDPVHDLAAQILSWGRHERVPVAIDIPAEPIDLPDVHDVHALLERALPLARGASGARLSARREGSSLVLRFVAAGCMDCSVENASVGAATMVCLGEGDLMVEARYEQ